MGLLARPSGTGCWTVRRHRRVRLFGDGDGQASRLGRGRRVCDHARAVLAGAAAGRARAAARRRRRCPLGGRSLAALADLPVRPRSRRRRSVCSWRLAPASPESADLVDVLAVDPAARVHRLRPLGTRRGRRARPAAAGGCGGGLLPALLRAHGRQSTAPARAVGGARGQRPTARRDGPGGGRDDGGARAGALGAATARRDGRAGPGAGGGRRGVRGRRTARSGRRAGRAGAGRGEDAPRTSWRAPTSCAPAIRWASFTRCCAPPSTAGWRTRRAARPTGAPRSCWLPPARPTSRCARICSRPRRRVTRTSWSGCARRLGKRSPTVPRRRPSSTCGAPCANRRRHRRVPRFWPSSATPRRPPGERRRSPTWRRRSRWSITPTSAPGCCWSSAVRCITADA